MSTTTPAKPETSGPVIFSVTRHGERTEVRDLDAFRAENPEAEAILADLLLSGVAEDGEAHYELADAQLLIQKIG